MRGLIPVVIPVFGREDVFGTVGFLRQQPYAGQLRFFVIDNGNRPELSMRLKGLSDDDCDVVSFPDNRGGSAGYIAGVTAAMKKFPDAQYVWLLDDDAKPNAETLPALVAEMDRLVAENPQTASVGSTVLNADDASRIIECGARYNVLLGLRRPQLAGRSIADVGRQTLCIDYSAACSLLVNVAAIRECGFWEDVFIHLDDIEWGVRVTKAGWRNYATTASTVVHPEGGVTKSGVWICYFDSRNQLWLASKYGRANIACAYVKDLIKDVRDVLCGHADRLPYRRLAHADFKAGIRRTRAEVMAVIAKREGL